MFSFLKSTESGIYKQNERNTMITFWYFLHSTELPVMFLLICIPFPFKIFEHHSSLNRQNFLPSLTPIFQFQLIHEITKAIKYSHTCALPT
uniref:Uncharacterized protein n=1 Tax=Glossina palpalis gambiensis TaxID=67801 RepID=A0A1B0BFS5_9MUSC